VFGKGVGMTALKMDVLLPYSMSRCSTEICIPNFAFCSATSLKFAFLIFATSKQKLYEIPILGFFLSEKLLSEIVF
jgi:hypothetical protein